MYFLKRTRTFEKSLRKIKKSGARASVLQDTDLVVTLLLKEKILPLSCQDHQLTGEYAEYRECHIRGDLLLIYEIKKENAILILHDIGSHSQLFG